jgi:hypothetical protein
LVKRPSRNRDSKKRKLIEESDEEKDQKKNMMKGAKENVSSNILEQRIKE